MSPVLDRQNATVQERQTLVGRLDNGEAVLAVERVASALGAVMDAIGTTEPLMFGSHEFACFADCLLQIAIEM
jgi:hypothetical protein